MCPPHRWLPARDGAADGRRRARAPIRSRSPSSPPKSRAAIPRDAIALVESVGGVRSPLATDGDTVTLVTELRPALVVLVADAELGTINVVRLSVDVLLAHRVVVYLNRYDADDELHVRNHDWLATRHGPRSRRRPRGARGASSS